VLLDAISWRIPLVSDIPTIIFGADVTHPETGEDSSPSIAAVWLVMTPYFCITCKIICMLFPLSNTLLAGRCFSRLARNYKVCWISLCPGSSTRAHSRPLQDMARSPERHCNGRHDQVFI
jgi:hypothetical protein